MWVKGKVFIGTTIKDTWTKPCGGVESGKGVGKAERVERGAGGRQTTALEQQ